MLKVNAIGDTCPIPVVKTKDAIRRLGEGGVKPENVGDYLAVPEIVCCGGTWIVPLSVSGVSNFFAYVKPCS